jgi:hypothetical protein
MNTIEHNRIEREEFTGIYYGVVLSVEDPEKVGRIKVRVRGIFDEPIKKEDIPWAVPTGNSGGIELGSEVAVWFTDGDIERPNYMPKTYLDKKQIEDLDKLLAGVSMKKKDSAKSGVSVVSKSFDEPVSDSDGKNSPYKKLVVLPLQVDKENGETVDTGSPDNGLVVEVNREKGKEEVSIYHPSGTFIDIREDGSVVIHSASDIYNIADGIMGVSLGGDLLIKVDGSVEVSAMEIKIKALKVTVTGGELDVSGSVVPTGSGPFCGLPSCIFSGAPHSGSKVLGT